MLGLCGGFGDWRGRHSLPEVLLEAEGEREDPAAFCLLALQSPAAEAIWKQLTHS